MSVTQYIGARYVPLFADPIDWDINSAYEPLTIVYYQGNSYTSKQAVPSNVDITNTDYWVITGNYNAQIEQYRREVQTFDGRITANAQAIADEVTARMQQDTEIRALITALDGDLDTETSAREAADTQIRSDFAAADSALGARISTLESAGTYVGIIGDSYSDSAIGANWVSDFANNVGKGIINVADNGSGFVRPGSRRSTTFKTQLDELAADANFSNCDTIIVYGGVNDRGHTSSEMGNAFSEFMSAYRALASTRRLPRLIVVYGNAGHGKYFGGTMGAFKNYGEWLDMCKRMMRSRKMPITDGAEWWLACMPSNVYKDDHLHPNEAGYAQISALMASVYNGCYDGIHRYYNEEIIPATGVTVPSGARTMLKFDNGIAQMAVGGLTFDPAQLESTTMALMENFQDESYWTNYGAGLSSNDGFVYADTNAFRIAYTGSALQMCKIRIHRFSRAVTMAIQGGYASIGSFTYEVPYTNL